MRSKRALFSGLVGGIVLWISGFVLHGQIMGNTYLGHTEVISQEGEPMNMFWLLTVAVGVAVVAAFLFTKTRGCWAEGVTGGAGYGLYLGFFALLPRLYSSLTSEAAPYSLSWCWAGISLIEMVILGVVLAAVYQQGFKAELADQDAAPPLG